MFDNHVTLLVGETGCGKSAIASEAARAQSKAGLRTTLVELRIVRPFDRGRCDPCDASAQARIARPEGVERVESNDATAFMPLLCGLARDANRRIVVDPCSDSATTRVLGSCLETLPARVIDRIMVVNFLRPFTRTVPEALVVAHDLQASMGVPITGIVGNTNLLGETTEEQVIEGYGAARSLAAQLGVPLLAIAAAEPLARSLSDGRVACPVLRLGEGPVEPDRSAEGKVAGKRLAASARRGEASCHRS